ncbi:MAG: hypothetical protein II060_04015 [Bacteroidales bacterium]|nr:hypothetical protein [Bacteroidales bacterium]
MVNVTGLSLTRCHSALGMSLLLHCQYLKQCPLSGTAVSVTLEPTA